MNARQDFSPIKHHTPLAHPAPTCIPAPCPSLALMHSGMDDMLEHAAKNPPRASKFLEALQLAASTGKTQYVNVFRPDPRNRGEWFLFVDPFKRADCCAIATPDGGLEFVVQGYSHQVALTQGEQA